MKNNIEILKTQFSKIDTYDNPIKNLKDLLILQGTIITEKEIQYLILIQYQNQQNRKKIEYAFLYSGYIPDIQNKKVLAIVAFAAIGFFLAPVLGIGAITGALIGASIGWRLFGGSKKKSNQNTKSLKQERTVSSPGFDSPPQPPTIGSPIPLVFTNTTFNPNGGVRLNGNVVNAFIKTYQNTQILYTLTALGLGEFSEIDTNALLIDNQPLDNFFSDVITSEFVLGTENQSRFEDFNFYSQSISPSSNSSLGVSYRGLILENSIQNNSFNVSEEDFDSYVASENYRVNRKDFKIINKIKQDTTYKIFTNINLNDIGDRKVYSTYKCVYETSKSCTRIDLNFAFDIWARKKSDNELTTFAIVFDLYLNGVFINRFYEANKKEGTIRRSITLENLNYSKHKIETYSHTYIYDSIQPIRIDDTGVIRKINSGKFINNKEVVISVESRLDNQNDINQINTFLNTDEKSQMSSDRGSNGRLTSVNEIVFPSDIDQSFMTNYKNLVLVKNIAKASDNLQSSPAYSHLVKKAIRYRNHLSAGKASIGSGSNILIANGVNLSEIFIGAILRNISRQTESLIINISGSQITTQFSLNWQSGEDFLIYFEDSINYFPDIFVYTRLNKLGGLKGLKVSEKFINYPSICESRRFCKANGFYWDGVIESPTEWSEWVMQESLGSLLYPSKFAGNYGLKPESYTNPTDIFNASRIIPGSFNQSKPDSSKINCVQLTYNANIDNDFIKSDRTVTVMTADAYYNREELQIENINYESITNENQAKKVSARYLKSRILQNKVITFNTGITGFNCREGDLIIVQFSLTEKEAEISGFALSVNNIVSGSQEITLSKKITQTLNNQGYKASIYHLESGNVQIDKNFQVLANGNLLLSGLTEQIKPARENYNADIIIINKNISEKLFRISSIKPNKYEIKITAINWTQDILNDSDLFFIT